MGGLNKTKRDQIARLREQGYTQKETAGRVKVNLRTVRKYDPLHQSRQRGQRSVEDRLAVLEDGMRATWDWIDLLHCAMLRSKELGKSLEEDTYHCLRCDGKLKFDDETTTYICRDCGHKFPPSLFWCYHCLSQQEMDYVEATGELVCRKCGAVRYSR